MRSESFSARFSRLRQEAGLTATALASPNYTVSYVSQIESGRRKPSDGALRFFAERLGTTETYLRTGIPDGLEGEIEYGLENVRLLLIQGRTAEAHESLRGLIHSIDEYGLESLLAKALQLDGNALLHLGRTRDALDLYEQALGHGLEGRDRAETVAALAQAYALVGDLTYAAELVESFLKKPHVPPLEPAAMTGLHTVLVSIYFERGDVVRADRAASRALATADEAIGFNVRANALWSASRVAAEQKRYDEALDLARRARILLEDLEDHRRLASVHTVSAFLCLEAEPPRAEEANRHLDTAEELLGSDAPSSYLSYLHHERARLALIEGRPAEALEHADRALEHTIDDRLELGRSLLTRGRVLVELGEATRAAASFHQAAGVFSKAGARQQEASCWREIGELEIAAGNADAGLRALRAGLEALDPKRVRA